MVKTKRIDSVPRIAKAPMIAPEGQRPREKVPRRRPWFTIPRTSFLNFMAAVFNSADLVFNAWPRFSIARPWFSTRGTWFSIRRPWFSTRGPWFSIPRPWFSTPGRWFSIPRPWCSTRGPGFQVRGLGFQLQGPGFQFQGHSFHLQVPGFQFRGSGFQLQGAGVKFRGPSSQLGALICNSAALLFNSRCLVA